MSRKPAAQKDTAPADATPTPPKKTRAKPIQYGPGSTVDRRYKDSTRLIHKRGPNKDTEKRRALLQEKKDKNKEIRQDRLDHAIRYVLAGHKRDEAGNLAQLTSKGKKQAGVMLCQYLSTPEGQERFNMIREEWNREHYLTAEKIREMRCDIAKDRNIAPKDRLRAMSDECRMMGYDKASTEGAVKIVVNIGTPVEPQHAPIVHDTASPE